MVDTVLLVLFATVSFSCLANISFAYEKYFADSIYINFILTKTSRNSPIVHLLNRNWLNITDKDYSMLGKVHANTSMYVVYFSYYLPNTAGHFKYVLAHSGWLCYILLDFAL